RAARRHDAHSARDLLQRARTREAQARSSQGQEAARQARDLGQARLAAPEGAAHAGEGLMRAADEGGSAPSERERLLAIEGAAVRAWPAGETREVDGWLWRYSGGGSQRANSVSA